MAQVYVWGKYNLNVKYEEKLLTDSPKLEDFYNLLVGKSYSFSAVTGRYSLNDAVLVREEDSAAQYPYAIYGASSGDHLYYAKNADGAIVSTSWGAIADVLSYTVSGKSYYPSYYGVKVTKEKGAYIRDVTSESENTYPKDGISGSYYYVFKYVVPSVQSITVPGAAMTGQSVDIFFEAADRAESYKLERKVDSNGWTQVYEGAELAYADTIQPGWTSVQYRVSAGISGVYSTPMVSNTVSIIPTSALVISGTDGNLGTITAPVAYSVTSDTGNQITVTEIINGHERTLTPTSGQLITIPVSMLDPGAGAITIKASVQAASGIVNQTRNWTYTKTSLALPVAPYRVERLQGKECDVMPQTLAEAVFMPDGSSVAGPVIGRNVIRSYPVASGQSIQAGDVVDVVEGQVQKTVTPVANEEKVYDKSTGGQSLISCAYLNSEYSVVASKTNGVNSANVNLISNKDGSRITANTVDSPSGQTVASLSIARLRDTQFVVGFASSQNVFLSVGTVSGESINLGSRYTLMALQSGWNCDICIVPFSENQAFVVTCNGSNNYPSGSILSISGSTITKGAWTHPDGVGRPGVMSAARLPDSDGKKRVCVCFNDVNDGNKGKAVIATIDSSNVVTWGSVVTIVPSVVNGMSCVSVGAVIYVVFDTTVYILNDSLSVLGQEKYDTNTHSDTRLTLTSFDNFAVGTYFGKNHTDAAVIRWDGEKVSISEPYSFSPVGYANYISTARISNDRMIVAYQSAGSGNYGTTTILTVMGNQIAGSFVDGSQDAIALKSGTAGQSIEVIYSGTVAADWVTEGQVVDSPGVYGAGVMSGVLQAWSKDRPVDTKIATGSYIGTGTYGEGNPNSITFDFTPILFWVVKYRVEGNTYFAQEENESPMIYTPILSENYTEGGGFYNDSAASRSYAKVADNGKTIIWYHADNASKQLNSSGYAYYYIAIG